MRAGRIVLALAVLAATALVGAASAGGSDRDTAPQAADQGSSQGGPASGLPIRLLAGQRVIASYEGREVPQRLFEMIERGEVAGVIFFGGPEGNIDSKSQLAEVARELQRARRQSSLPRALRRPLLLMTDQEGGIVRRLPGAPELSEQEIGESPNSGPLATIAGRGAARNLAGARVNVNLAPVLGVERPEGGALAQFGRLYSENADKVSRLGRNFITAHQEQGVAATAKHFPGLGSAIENTDETAVTIDLSRQTLRFIDELPYESAIPAGVRLVMIDNALYPALDPEFPASLSHTIIHDELRRRHRFRGVTITDALEAGALDAFGTIPERGVLAAGAGADLLLYSAKDIEEGFSGLQALRRALRSGELARGPYEKAANRVLELRRDLKVNPSGALGPP